MRFDTRLRLRIAALVVATVVLGCDEPAKVTEQPTCTNCAGSEDELIQLLAKAYRERDFARYTDLFPTAADAAPFFFFLNAPVNGIDNWDLTEELRIHRRMFKPGDPLPGETQVPTELWLVSITINLSRTAATWVERTDLYKTPANPNGLDSNKWKVTEGEFHADIMFETQGDTDYRVDGRHNFIVIQDLEKTAGAPRRYVLYRWEDLDPPVPGPSLPATAPALWGSVKMLYR
jgi:hypothetical protein